MVTGTSTRRMTAGVTSSSSIRSSAISVMLCELANRHAAHAVASIQLQRAARGDQHLVQTFATLLMRMQHVVGVPLELGRGALIARHELGASVSALLAAYGGQCAGRGMFVAVVLREARGEYVAAGRVVKADSIPRGK